MYFVIEGQDATGKDTQANLLADYFRKQGKEVACYAESGTASPEPFVAGIASLNYGNDYDLDHATHALLFLVNRYDQWRRLAKPVLENGGVAVTSRNWLSTLIYEGYAGGADTRLIMNLHELVMPEEYFRPDGIVILTMSDEARAERLLAQGKRKEEVFKSMDSDFHQTLNRSYLEVAADFEIPTLDASADKETVHRDILKLFSLDKPD